MLSTILILVVASSAMALAWSLLYDGRSGIRSEQDWEEKRHEIDVEILRRLLDRGEERYLRSCFSRKQFHSFQRRRIRLALRMLQLVEENAGMLMRLGQLARMKGDAVLTQKADELVATAIQLRLNLFLAKLCLSLKWLSPSSTIYVPAFEVRYENLLDCLVFVRQRGQQALS